MKLIDADALEKEGWSLCRTFRQDINTMVYEVKKLSDFSTIEERKWIPCSERLPEINHFMYDVEPFSDEVLVAIKNEYGAEDIWIACLEQRHGWNLERDDRFRWRVIAWMPLPEPYREEATDETP